MIDRVGLFVTCLADTLFPEVGKATVTVLERLGLEVAFPPEQTCCGQMHLNSGYPDEARALARRFVEVFEPFDAVVSPSASCVALVRGHYPELLDGADRGVPARTWELSRFLVDRLGVEVVGSTYEGTVTYHPTCCGFGGTFAVKNADVSAAMLDEKLANVLATGAGAVCACDASCLMHMGGGLRRRGAGVRPLHLAEILAS